MAAVRGIVRWLIWKLQTAVVGGDVVTFTVYIDQVAHFKVER